MEAERPRRGRLLLVVLAIAMAIGAYFFSRPAPEIEAAPIAEAELPVDAGSIEAVAPVEPLDAGEPVHVIADPQRVYGFCDDSATGNSSTHFSIEHDLAQAQQAWIARAIEAATAPRLHELLLKLSRRSLDSAELGELRKLADDAEMLAHLELGEALQLKSVDLDEALRLMNDAVVQAPKNEQVLAELGLIERRAGHTAPEVAAWRSAMALDPTSPALAVQLGLALRNTPELDEASADLGVYLRAEPDDVAVGQLRSRIDVQREIQAGDARIEREGLTLLYPPASMNADQADAVATAILTDLDDAARLLGTPRREDLTAIIYPGKSELMAVSCVNAWTGALFDGVLRVPIDGRRPGKVELAAVRHEALHAQLFVSAPGAPIWFHEGLAQRFAGEQGSAAWGELARNHTAIPLNSLDGSFQAFHPSGDAKLAYAQSRAMVEMVVEHGGEASLRDAVLYLRANKPPSRLLAQLLGQSDVTASDVASYMANHPRVP